MNLVISNLTIYPVKSCAGISLKEARVIDTGFEHDREWMIVTPDGEFITQRQNPKMALIIPEVGQDILTLNAEGKESVVVAVKESGQERRVTIWTDTCEAIDQGDKAAVWLTEFLGKECRLVRMSPDYKRKVKAKYATSESDIVGFADGYPFLVISQASLDDLNRRLGEALPMNRFRPNIVISGGEAFQEDTWKRIKAGKIILAIIKPCVRCEITTVNQLTGVKGIEPLEELGKFRSSPKGVKFGQNAIQMNQGTMKIGDTVEVIEIR